MKRERGKHRLAVNVQVIVFKEGDQYVSYSPALDLSSCGTSVAHAMEMFREASNLFFSEIIKMGTVDQVLQDCGWHKVTKPRPRWVPPEVVANITESVAVPV